jgi:hypothetical protein
MDKNSTRAAIKSSLSNTNKTNKLTHLERSCSGRVRAIGKRAGIRLKKGKRLKNGEFGNKSTWNCNPVNQKRRLLLSLLE